MNRQKSPKKFKAELFESLESRCLLSSSGDIIVMPSLTVTASAASSSTVSGYTPAQIKAAYGISSISLSGVTGDGSGQTIAIVDAYSDPNIASDLAVFDKEFSLSAPASFKQISVTGSTTKLPTASADWSGEIALDVEWAHAIAPKANIILVDATTDSVKNLMAAVKYASSISTVSVVSMSWGTSEFSGESAYDSYFTTPSGHIGITYVAASGDEGAAGGAEYPAVSPNVLSVGGTTLSISSSGSVTSESAWSDSSGGTSLYEKASAAQSTALGNTYSESPVVSYDADPNTGFAVYDSVADDGVSGWQEVGGTSAGAPQWAALVAIADQGRVSSGAGTLDGATGTLPAIYSIYSNATNYAADFTDITSGSSVQSGGGGGFGGGRGGPFWGGPGGRFGGGGRQTTSISATTGYDTLTGVGTPKAAALVNALVAAKVTTAAKVSKATTSKVTAATKTKKATKSDEGVESIVVNRIDLAPARPSMHTMDLAVPSVETVSSVFTFTRPDMTSDQNDITSSPWTVDTAATTASISPILDLGDIDQPLSTEDTIRRTNSVLAAGKQPTVFDVPSFTPERVVPTGTAIAARRRAEMEEHSSAMGPMLLALAADAAFLGIYHAKKRRGKKTENPFSAGQLAIEPA